MASDDEILGRILRRYLSDGEYRYWFFDETHLTLDARVAIDAEEHETLTRVVDAAHNAATG